MINIPKTRDEWNDFHGNPKKKKWIDFDSSKDWNDACFKAEVRLMVELIDKKLNYLLGENK